MELNAHLSYHLHTGEKFGAKAPSFQKAFIIYPWRPGILKKLKANEYAGIRPKDLNRLIMEDQDLLRKKAVALVPLSFKNNEDFYLHCLLHTMKIIRS